MKVNELFADKTVFSFEVYPAKKTAPIQVVYDAVNALADLGPDFISVTYGAGGGAANASATVEIASLIENTYHLPAVAHLPGINLTREELGDLLMRLAAHRLENVLALRGDVIPGTKPTGEFAHASEVAEFIGQHIPDYFNIIGACYPEVHPEATSAADDLHWLRHKIDTGVDQLATQLFFDNQHFYNFLIRAREAGITVPIEAGIMPVVNARQAARMVELCGTNLPPAFVALVERYGDNDDEMRAAGIDYATAQILDLIEHDVDGIHLYTMNDPNTAAAISAVIKPLTDR